MHSWFFYFLKKSISQRMGRFVISSSAVTLTVSVVTALVTLSAGIRDKIGLELKQYGANMIVTNASGGEIDDAAAHRLSALSPYIRDAAFQVYDTALVKDMAVEVIGMEPGKMTGYRLQGKLPQGADEIMIGINVKDALRVKPGDAMKFDSGKTAYRVTAVFEKGSDEDAAVVMPIEAAQRLLGKTGVSTVLLNGDTQHLRDIEDAVHRQFPLLQVKTLRQVAVAEERILARIQLLMFLVTIVVLFSSIIALGSTMGANVIERMEEIGLMKSVGATRGDIRKFFMSEAALAGLAGALAGYLLGILSAEAVSRTAFGSYIPVNALVVFVCVFLGVSIAVVSTYFPVKDAMKAAPAQILRGE